MPSTKAGEVRVKANRGAAGVNGETLTMFGKDLKGNLYKVWNEEREVLTRLALGRAMPLSRKGASGS